MNGPLRIDGCRDLNALAALSPRPGRAAAPASPDEGHLAFTVYGIPAPQGSKSAKGSYTDDSGKRHVRLVESSKKVKPWRARVEAAAREEISGRHGFPLTGPLEMSVIFSLPRPARMPKERVIGSIALPMCYPDTSKLLRSTEDALTAAGAWVDDAQVVNFRALGKRYVGESGALDRPGAVVRVWRIGGAP